MPSAAGDADGADTALICHSRTRLRGHRLRRESGGTGLPFFDIPEMRFRLQCLQ